MASHKYTRKDIERLLGDAVGKTLGEVDSKGVFLRAEKNPKITGIAGDVIEQSVLGYPANSDGDPDLDVDGTLVELKTTGLRKKNGEIEAKEPMSITAVRIGSIQKEDDFEKSHFWLKCSNLLIVFYLYASKDTVNALGYRDFPIMDYCFNEFSDEDKDTLRNDWTIVRDFLRELDTLPCPENEYPRLSSELRDRLALIDTAPKYPHPPRFRLKRTFVTSIYINSLKRKKRKDGSLDEQIDSYAELDAKCRSVRLRFGGMSLSQIAEELGIDIRIAKNNSEQIVSRMIGGKAKKMSGIELFQKFGISCKTVVLTEKGGRTEDMKLFPLDLDEIQDAEVSFEDSSFFDYFWNHQLLAAVFQEPYDKCPYGEIVFRGFKRMTMPESFIEGEAHKLFMDIRSLILEDRLRDEIVCNKDGTPRINLNGTVSTAPNFPKSKDGNLFIRGGGTDSLDKPVVVNGVHMYRQSVWCKGVYIVSQLEGKEYC